MTELEIVTEERARYPYPPNNDECVDICNRVAHRLRAGEAGLTWSDAGLIAKLPDQNHGVGDDGNRYGVDIIMLPSGVHYDILQNAGNGGTSVPQWNRASPNADPALYREPYPTTDPDPENPPPDEDDECPCSAQFDMLLAVQTETLENQRRFEEDVFQELAQIDAKITRILEVVTQPKPAYVGKLAMNLRLTPEGR